MTLLSTTTSVAMKHRLTQTVVCRQWASPEYFQAPLKLY